MKKNPWNAHRQIFRSSVAAQQQSKPGLRWRVLPILWLAFKRTSMVVGAIVLVSAVVMALSFSSVYEGKKVAALPDKMVLYLELDGSIPDHPEDGGGIADVFSEPGPTLREFIAGIDRARDDKRVKGIVADLSGGGFPIAHVQELRAAIKRFEKSGKFAYIYGISYGDVGSMGSYYLASAFDEIWMQPMGLVGITGMRAEVPFFKDVADKIGIEPQFFKRKEYKTAYESFTNSEMSEANREELTGLIDDISDVVVHDIAKDRKMSEKQFRALVDKGLFVDEEAKKSGLIDVLDYGDVLTRKVNERVTGDPETKDLAYVNVDDYISRTRPHESIAGALIERKMGLDGKDGGSGGKPTIALIYASGVIMPSDFDGSGEVAAADDIAQALGEAAKDDSIDEVVLRIDSPGGSPVASETILRAIQQVQNEGKDVVVSMGSVAASGGYWIATAADRIFVLPTTITGSIGVLGGKVSMQEMWKKIGVSWGGVHWGKNAGMWSMNEPFSKSGAERMNAMLDNVYKNFVARVAKGRKMSEEDVEKIARGRVWSGKRAIEIGLADQLGGLDDALDYAARQIGAKDRSGVSIRVLPKPLSPVERLVNMLEGQVQVGDVAGVQAELLKPLLPLARQAAVMARDPLGYSVYMPIEVQ